MKPKHTIKYSSLLMLFLLMSFGAFAQKIIINGQVKDEIGESIIGVNIVEVDQNGRFIAGTTTDINGNFTLKVSSSNAMVKVSYIGYKNQTLELNNKTTFSIVLEKKSTDLSEVVVTGKKLGNDGVIAIRDRATAVSRIEFEKLQSAQTTTVGEMLQGRLSNVDIAAVSGDPGAGLNIRIRGTATLNARNEPLIVVNGIPYDPQISGDFDFATADLEKFGNLIDVSPEDIESIEVLKDAASTAVYGAKASNGVLMIQTKRGTKSKPIFEYTTKFTRAVEPPSIPLLDGAGYARLIKEAHFNNDAGTFKNDEIEFDPEWKNYHNFSQDINWLEEITQTGYTTDHSFSVRGGGDKSRYKMSLSYFDQSGTTIGTALKKLNLSTSLDYNLSSKVRLKTDIMYTRYDQDATYDAEEGAFWNKRLRSVAIRKMPNMSVYEMDTLGNALSEYYTPYETMQGTAAEMYNPVAFANLGKHKRLSDNTRAAFTIRWNLAPGLIYDGTITLDIFDQKRTKFLPFKAIGYDYNSILTNQAYEHYHKKTAINTLNKLIYRLDLGIDHEITLLGLVETEDHHTKVYSTRTSKSASPELTDPAGAVNLQSFSSSISEYRSIGSYISANYKFRDTYLLSAGVRYEGNSKFSEESRFGFFPMATMAWRLSSEPWLSGARFINDFKLRASWGVSGNMPGSNYLYFNTYDASTRYGYNGVSGVKPEGIELTNLQWETIEQINPGISFFGFNNRLNIEVDVYHKLTRNLYLRNSKIPTTSGYTAIDQNEGEMVNKGWELMIDAKIVQSKNFNFSINFNASHNENIVLQLPENYALEYGNMLDNGRYKVNIEPGQALGGFYGYKYDGVYSDYDDVYVLDKDGRVIYDITGTEPLNMIHGANGYEFEPGDAKYRDKNNDGVINELDLYYLGDLNPDLMGGIGPRFQYKNLVFNMFFYYKVGQNIINQARMDLEKMYNHDNQSKATNWRWRRPGDVTDMPRALYNKGYNWMGSDRFVEDGSYIRLKTMSASYSLSDKACKRLNVSDIKIYGTAYNLFTWTRYSGQDPDIASPSHPQKLPKDTNRTPPSKRITIGLNIKF